MYDFLFVVTSQLRFCYFRKNVFLIVRYYCFKTTNMKSIVIEYFSNFHYPEFCVIYYMNRLLMFQQCVQGQCQKGSLKSD